MPDTRFSWRGLREHLRKFLWVYLVGIALCLAGTHLLWTVTRPRLSNEQVVTVIMADSYSNPAPLDDVAAEMLARTQPFDERLKDVAFESMMYSDDYTSRMVLVTRLAVGEGDAFLASQAAMDALATSDALLPLDESVAAGWLGEYGLEPYYATVQDDQTGEETTFLAGLRIDPLTALIYRGAFNNQGAFLCVANNGGNVETTMKALETMVEILSEASKDVGTKAA